MAEAEHPFETYFYPLIQSVFQTFSIRLTGSHYIVTGHMFRPLMYSATVLLSSGDLQILDTVNLHLSWKEGRILGTATETAIGQKVYEHGEIKIRLIDACLYPDVGGSVILVAFISYKINYLYVHNILFTCN